MEGEDNQFAVEAGKRLEQLLKLRRMTAADLAKLINVHYDTVRKWIKGKRLLKGENLKKVLDALQVSADYLLMGKADELFSRYEEVMSLPKDKRFDKIVEIAE